MNKEDIISTAIHEVFLCGKEAGESYQRLYEIMQQKIDAAKQGKSVIDDMAKYDGFLPHVELAKLKEENSELAKKCTGIRCDYNVLKQDYENMEKRAVDLALENDKLGKILEEKDATITELRSKLEDNKECYHKDVAEHIIGSQRKDMDRMTQHIGKLVEDNSSLQGRCNALESEIAGLKSQLANKDAIIKDKIEEIERLRATVPVASPTGNDPSPCIEFSEFEQVLISGSYFGDGYPSHRATILGVMRGGARVLITEKDSDFEDDEEYIPYEYLKKI